MCLDALSNALQQFFATDQPLSGELPCISETPVFHAILFSGPSCSNCVILKDILHTLQGEFCNQLQIEELDIYDFAGNALYPGYDLFQAARNHFNSTLPPDHQLPFGIPFVVFSLDGHIMGAGDDIVYWRNLIQGYLTAGGADWPDYLPGFTPTCW
jgi:hypothetical protein